jgi:transglutaminase superfamily protein
VARSNVRFADPFAVDRIVLKIRPRDTSQPLPDFTAHNQRLLGPGLVEVVRPSHSSRTAAPAPGHEYLEPNALVESSHADIVAIARSLKKDTPLQTAEALTAWTAEHVTMDAGIVMAPASELVRDRRATCMGYATLLATLARAATIPSRVAMGYVYYGGIWGGHAWTEMFINGQWLPFDGAVYAPGVASAMRLSVGTSSLVDGGGSLNSALSALFGKVDVETVEYNVGGRVMTPQAGEPSYSVAGRTYVNTGLGLRVRAEQFDIERADTTWPSTLVVAFRRGETVVELHHRSAYPEKPQPPDTTTITERVGGTILLWTASGPDAAAALRELVDKVERVK